MHRFTRWHIPTYSCEDLVKASELFTNLQTEKAKYVSALYPVIVVVAAIVGLLTFADCRKPPIPMVGMHAVNPKRSGPPAPLALMMPAALTAEI